MSQSSNVSVNVLGGPVSILGIIFVIAKLLGIIKWSWWLVLLPFWGGLALLLLVLGVLLVFALIAALVTD